MDSGRGVIIAIFLIASPVYQQRLLGFFDLTPTGSSRRARDA
jgi:hypothetical protein